MQVKEKKNSKSIQFENGVIRKTTKLKNCVAMSLENDVTRKTIKLENDDSRKRRRSR